MMQEWSYDWRVIFAAVRLAAAGLYHHAALKQVEVADVPVRQMVDHVQTFISKRGYALERLDATVSIVFEDWGDAEHPRPKHPRELSISLRIENEY